MLGAAVRRLWLRVARNRRHVVGRSHSEEKIRWRWYTNLNSMIFSANGESSIKLNPNHGLKRLPAPYGKGP